MLGYKQQERENNMTKKEQRRSWRGAVVLTLGLFVLCGLAGKVEAGATPPPPEREGLVAPAYEVALQTWYSYPKAKRGRYCDKRKPKRIVKRNHAGATAQGKRELRTAYRIILRDC